MSELVQRLARGSHRVVCSRAGSASELKRAIELGYVLLKFPDTRGGTELGMAIDLGASRWEDADFEAGCGVIHLEGELELDYLAVRLMVDLDVGTLAGQGYLRVQDSVAEDRVAEHGVAREQAAVHSEVVAKGAPRQGNGAASI